MSDVYIRHENHWRKAQRRLPERPEPPEPPRRESGREDLGLPFGREAEEAFLEVGVSVLMSLPDEENLPKVGPDAA